MTLASEARVATTMPRRFMTQLCKHFEHKLPVSYDETKGRIEFSAGVCLLAAGEDALVLRAEAADTESLRRVEDVIAPPSRPLRVPREAGDRVEGDRVAGAFSPPVGSAPALAPTGPPIGSILSLGGRVGRGPAPT